MPRRAVHRVYVHAHHIVRMLHLGYHTGLTPLEPQSRFGDKPLEISMVCPQNGTAVLKGLIYFVRRAAVCRVMRVFGPVSLIRASGLADTPCSGSIIVAGNMCGRYVLFWT